jgi:hypothetical protein
MPLVLEGYERYYCARLATGVLGAPPRWTGYVLAGIRAGTCTQITARYDRIRIDSFPVEDLDVRPDMLRQGVSNGA